ncbi:Serine/threonine-protein kinase prp4 [Tolypocladium capitatum]|uniref:non-specific serine/threonine protein kinase n=1 Tax=Tolypocladium capitatum TaxID=45235 RepID=A0A2K3Q6M7_9HYPO|nr:Serine/threonine-protein kinase prp4 [Tolypocladium capitatum]
MSSSSDEGEIRDDGNGENRDPSPALDSASRGSGSSRRSRSPRGFKRSRDDSDHYGGGRDYDPRRSRARHDERLRNGYHASGRDRDSRPSHNFYDDAPRDERRRPRVSYEDLDAPSSRASSLHVDSRQNARNNDSDQYRNRDRDRGGRRDRGQGRDWGRDHVDNHGREPSFDELHRRRSRSPHRSRRDERPRGDRLAEDGIHDGGHRSARTVHFGDEQEPRRKRRGVEEDAPRYQGGGKYQKQNGAAGGQTAATNPSECAREPSPEQDYELQAPVDEDAEIERRRKRREELLAKSSSATPLLIHAVGAAAEKAARIASPASTQPETQQSVLETGTPRTPASGKPSSLPRSVPVVSNGLDWASPRSPASRDEPPHGGNPLDDNGLINTHGNAVANEEDGPSAADYDPTVDMREDEAREERKHGQTVMHGQAQPVESGRRSAQPPEAEDPNQASDQEDDDGFDMFADEFDTVQYAAQRKQQQPRAQAQGGMLEDEDKEGFYKVRIGEILGGRYTIKAVLGQGMYARVARALDSKTKEVVAVKLMRKNDAMKKGGYTEIDILKKLNAADMEDKKYIVRFHTHFLHRGFLCMVFEGLDMNLREVLRKFGKDVGINLTATRRFAEQIFIGLQHMRENHIIHADLKPDNILINSTRTAVKICDLGTAINLDDAASQQEQLTPYLVSRFYRAPEIVLGMPYGYPIDVWAIGCTLFELFTGKILFQGRNNNQMLKAMMQIRGRMHYKYYKHGKMWADHFDEKGSFISIEFNEVTNKPVKRTMTAVTPTRPLGTRLDEAGAGMSADEKKELDRFKDLLENCLLVNADKRITPEKALQHDFFTMAKARKKAPPEKPKKQVDVASRLRMAEDG